jgi:hypothetical protein
MHFVLALAQGEVVGIRQGKVCWKISDQISDPVTWVSSSLLRVQDPKPKCPLSLVLVTEHSSGRTRSIRIEWDNEDGGQNSPTKSDAMGNRHFETLLELPSALCTAKAPNCTSGVALCSVTKAKVGALSSGLFTVTESPLGGVCSGLLRGGLALCEWKPEELPVPETSKTGSGPPEADLLSDLIQNRLTLELEMMSEEEMQHKKMQQMLEDSNTRLKNWTNQTMHKFGRRQQDHSTTSDDSGNNKVPSSSSSKREGILASLQDSIQVRSLGGDFLSQYFVVKCELCLSCKAREDVDYHIGTSLALLNTSSSKGAKATVMESSCKRAPFTRLSRGSTFKFEVYFDVRNIVLSVGLGIHKSHHVQIFVCGFCQMYGEASRLKLACDRLDHSPKFTQTCGLAVDPFDGDLPFTHHLGDLEIDLQQMLITSTNPNKFNNNGVSRAIDYPCKVEVLLLSGKTGRLHKAEDSQALKAFKEMCTEFSHGSGVDEGQEERGSSFTYLMVENPLSPLAGCVLATPQASTAGPLVLHAHSSDQMLLLMEYLQHSLVQLDTRASLSLSPSLASYPTLDSFHHASLLLEFEIRQYRHLQAANPKATRSTNEAFSSCTWG